MSEEVYDVLGIDQKREHANQDKFGGLVTTKLKKWLRQTTDKTAPQLAHVKTINQVNHVPGNWFYFGTYKEDRVLTVGALLKSFKKSKVETEYRRFLTQCEEAQCNTQSPFFIFSIPSSRTWLALTPYECFSELIDGRASLLSYYSVVPSHGCVMVLAEEFLCAIAKQDNE